MNISKEQNLEKRFFQILPRYFLIITLFFLPSMSQADALKLTTVDWQPFYGHDLPEQGFFAAIIREAFKRAGYDIEINFQPWKRALETTQKGNYDGLLGAYYSEARSNFLNFTDVVYENEDIFLSKNKALVNYQNLSDLKDYRIGVMRGAAYSEELRKQGYKVVETNNEQQSLRMLCRDRLDLVLMSKMHYDFLFANEPDIFSGSESLLILDKPFKTYPLYVPITKKRPDSDEIVNRFNSALSELKQDGSYGEILNRFGLSSR